MKSCSRLSSEFGSAACLIDWMTQPNVCWSKESSKRTPAFRRGVRRKPTAKPQDVRGSPLLFSAPVARLHTGQSGPPPKAAGASYISYYILSSAFK